MNHRIQERLHPFVPQSRTAQDGYDFKGDRRLPYRLDDLRLGNLHPVEIFLRNPVVHVGQQGDHPVTMLHRLRPDLIGNIRISVGRSLGCIVPGDDLPPDEVHDPPEGLLLARRGSGSAKAGS